MSDIDDCDQQPCQHGGSCADRLNSFTCTCPTTWEGDICTIGNFYLNTIHYLSLFN